MWDYWKNYQKKKKGKKIDSLFGRDSVIFQIAPGPRFTSGLLFTKVQVKLIEVSCFTSTTIRKLWGSFDWIVFDMSFHAWSTFEFHLILVNGLRIIIWNKINKTLIKMVGEGLNLQPLLLLSSSSLRCLKNGNLVKCLKV